MDKWWIHAADVVLCTVVLRVIIGWLLAYPRLIRLIISLVLTVLVVVAVNVLNLPLAGLLVLLLLIPLVVILFLSFLPELGRVYQAASRGNLFRPKIFQSQEILPELAQSLYQFMQRKVGCLIVFPGSQDDDGLLSGGEEVDAKFNRSLLISLFDPHCPRHDGAVVIRNNRIVRIGAVLPLASAEGKESHLGTRHLAAMGLSERSDSHIFVVSEERGTLSHVHDGALRVIKARTVEELTAELAALMGGIGEGDEEQKRRALPFALWGMALLLAVLGSWQVELIKDNFRKQYTETVYFQSVNAPIQYTLDPERQFVSNWEATSAQVMLQVPEASLAERKPLSIVVDLRNEPFGKSDLALQSTMVNGLPSDARVQGFMPERIQFQLNEVQFLDVALKIPALEQLPDHLVVESKLLTVASMRFKIREANWKPGRAIDTMPVNLSFIKAAGEYQVPVQLVLTPTVEKLDATAPMLNLSVREKKK